MDIAKGEQVETELDRFIVHRDRQRRRSEGDRPAGFIGRLWWWIRGEDDTYWLNVLE